MNDFCSWHSVVGYPFSLRGQFVIKQHDIDLSSLVVLVFQQCCSEIGILSVLKSRHGCCMRERRHYYVVNIVVVFHFGVPGHNIDAACEKRNHIIL